jgi:predicted nucleic acid-binding protein
MSRTRYVETSALLRAIVENDAAVEQLLAEPATPLVTSALTILEASRTIARARRDGRLTTASSREADRRVASFERATDIRGIDDEVLHGARQEFPFEPVRSVDAIHLATLRLLDREIGPLAVVSCDDRVRRNAAQLGFAVLP